MIVENCGANPGREGSIAAVAPAPARVPRSQATGQTLSEATLASDGLFGGPTAYYRP
jgi:hypothetical protein